MVSGAVFIGFWSIKTYNKLKYKVGKMLHVDVNILTDHIANNNMYVDKCSFKNLLYQQYHFFMCAIAYYQRKYVLSDTVGIY